MNRQFPNGVMLAMALLIVSCDRPNQRAENITAQNTQQSSASALPPKPETGADVVNNVMMSNEKNCKGDGDFCSTDSDCCSKSCGYSAGRKYCFPA